MYITDASSSTVENVPCDIVSIDVPAGVQVQAYTVSLPLVQWWQKNVIGDSCSSNNNNGLSCPMTACTPSPPSVSSCSWHPPPSSRGFEDPTYPTWDSAYTGRKDIDPSSTTSSSSSASNYYLDGFNSTTRDFSEMKKWWPDYTVLWESAGLKNEPGVCSLKIRLEQTADTKGVCGYNPATTRAGEDATLTQPPNCKAILNNPSATPFAIVMGVRLGRTDTYGFFFILLCMHGEGGRPSNQAVSSNRARPPTVFLIYLSHEYLPYSYHLYKKNSNLFTWG